MAKNKVAKAPGSAVSDKAHITVILDRSGSMASVKDATRAGFDGFVSDQAKVSGKATLTLVQFDSDGIDTVHDRLPIGDVPPLVFEPRSTTPLYDAVGKTVAAMLAKPPEGRVMVVIITDGAENASHEYTRAKVMNLVSKARDKGWEFVFMGADIDAYDIGTGIGVAAASTYSYSSSPEGTQVAYAALTSTMTRSRTTGAALTMDDADRIGGVGNSGQGGINTTAPVMIPGLASKSTTRAATTIDQSKITDHGNGTKHIALR